MNREYKELNSRISIIIPVYNCEKNIEKCIKSLLAQTYKNFDIIIVDDGSSDRTLEICRNYERKYELIKVIVKKNGGPASARNVGLKAVTGEYTFFIDADDFLDKDCLKILIDNYKENTLVGVKCKIVSDNYEKYLKQNNKYTKDDFINKIIESKVCGFIAGFLLSSEIIRKNNIVFDEKTSLMEDTLFLVQYLKSIEQIKYISGAYYNYYQSNNSITRKKDKDKLKQNILDMIYSLEKIEIILNDNKIQKKINHKKIEMLNYEINKVTDSKELEYIFDDYRIEEKLKNLANQKIDLYTKLFLKLLINRKFNLLFIKKKIKGYIKKTIRKEINRQ